MWSYKEKKLTGGCNSQGYKGYYNVYFDRKINKRILMSSQMGQTDDYMSLGSKMQLTQNYEGVLV